MAHVLVVGGTGVLEKVSLFLASHDNVVTVVARSKYDFEKLAELIRLPWIPTRSMDFHNESANPSRPLAR